MVVGIDNCANIFIRSVGVLTQAVANPENIPATILDENDDDGDSLFVKELVQCFT